MPSQNLKQRKVFVDLRFRGAIFDIKMIKWVLSIAIHWSASSLIVADMVCIFF